MSLERLVIWADRAYFAMAIIAAIATGLTIVAGIWQNRLNAAISDTKDRAFADFKLATENETQALTAAVAEANARAAEANKVAEQERLARMKIEAGLASRRLSPEQASRFIASLAASRGAVPAIAVTVLGDMEARGFAEDLARAIDRAGISVRVDATGVMVPPPYGLIVTDAPTSAIRRSLDAAGLSARYNTQTLRRHAL
jgi:hypothetical protein